MNASLILARAVVLIILLLGVAPRASAQADFRTAKCPDCGCALSAGNCCCPKCPIHLQKYSGLQCPSCKAEDDARRRKAEQEEAERRERREREQAEWDRRQAATRAQMQAQADRNAAAQKSAWDRQQSQQKEFWDRLREQQRAAFDRQNADSKARSDTSWEDFNARMADIRRGITARPAFEDAEDSGDFEPGMDDDLGLPLVGDSHARPWRDPAPPTRTFVAGEDDAPPVLVLPQAISMVPQASPRVLTPQEVAEANIAKFESFFGSKSVDSMAGKQGNVKSDGFATAAQSLETLLSIGESDSPSQAVIDGVSGDGQNSVNQAVMDSSVGTFKAFPTPETQKVADAARKASGNVASKSTVGERVQELFEMRDSTVDLIEAIGKKIDRLFGDTPSARVSGEEVPPKNQAKPEPKLKSLRD